MNNRHLTLCIIGFLSFVFNLQGQSYIVQFNNAQAADDYFKANKGDFIDIENISKTTNIYSVYPKADVQFENLKNRSSVLHISPNAEVYPREIPNDSQYAQQWPLPLIDAEKAWNEVNHGLTYDGREIVIAILDASFQIDHPDLINNIWTNEEEIPGDGIDNDNNGYVDDYYGLHIDENNDNHPIGSHGTKVSGIIGAEGNNGIGITGVNWNVKMMIISGANTSADIIEGYEYALNQRRIYNQTNGERGAYVVVTNFSAGIPYVFGTSYPQWCSMYDAMGEVGILSVTAADNGNYDVDVEGDMPTTCQSDYLITVTSTDRFDQKAASAAFGSVNVDIGAPGESTFSTTNGDDFTGFTGTSAASPHVAGSIGLLYSANCPQLITSSIEFPSSAALTAKEAILSSSTNISTLSSRTVSGGRLNIFDAMSELSMLCATEQTSGSNELTIFDLSPNPTENELKFGYGFKRFNEHKVSIYNTLGKLIQTTTVTPSLFGAPVVTLDVSYLTPAMYFITMDDGEDVFSVKFFKN